MSTAQRERIQWWVEIIFKVGTPLGIILVGAGLNWLTAHFAPRDEFAKLAARVDAIERLLIRMESREATDQQHGTMLADHEGRIRALEKLR
jgi:hypothetical protein